MRTVIIIQARLGSSRLPAKIMLPLPNGKLVVEEVYNRCCEVDGVAEVVVACPEHDLPILAELPIDVIGPAGVDENDVLARYAAAARASKADRIVRITADCPLIDSDVVHATISQHRKQQAGYTSNSWPVRSWPHGYDCEVFEVPYLEQANRDPMRTPYDAEHVTPLIRRHAKHLATYTSPEDLSSMRMVLDTLEDYRTIWHVMSKSMARSAA